MYIKNNSFLVLFPFCPMAWLRRIHRALLLPSLPASQTGWGGVALLYQGLCTPSREFSIYQQLFKILPKSTELFSLKCERILLCYCTGQCWNFRGTIFQSILPKLPKECSFLYLSLQLCCLTRSYLPSPTLPCPRAPVISPCCVLRKQDQPF